MNTIRQLCDRCVVLDKGRIIFEGDVEEGIEHYMGTKMISESCVELTTMKRERDFALHPITMNKIWTNEGQRVIMPVGETLRLSLSFTGDRPFDDVYLRIIIKSADGTPITMCTTESGFSVDTCEKVMEMELDTTRLAPGKYTLSPVIYQVGELGNHVNLDVLRDVFSFEVTAKPGFNNNMVWLSRFWGHHYTAPLRFKLL